MIKSVSLKAHGSVQGVGFRYFTQKIADNMEIKGTVKNNINGTVSIEAEGEEASIDEFISKIKAGPSTFSKVSQLDISYNNYLKNYSKFTVIGWSSNIFNVYYSLLMYLRGNYVEN